MKNISKPPLPIEIYTVCQNVSFDDFREEVSRLEGKLTCHPHFEDYTYLHFNLNLEAEDYRSKCAQIEAGP